MSISLFIQSVGLVLAIVVSTLHANAAACPLDSAGSKYMYYAADPMELAGCRDQNGRLKDISIGHNALGPAVMANSDKELAISTAAILPRNDNVFFDGLATTIYDTSFFSSYCDVFGQPFKVNNACNDQTLANAKPLPRIPSSILLTNVELPRVFEAKDVIVDGAFAFRDTALLMETWFRVRNCVVIGDLSFQKLSANRLHIVLSSCVIFGNITVDNTSGLDLSISDSVIEGDIRIAASKDFGLYLQTVNANGSLLFDRIDVTEEYFMDTVQINSDIKWTFLNQSNLAEEKYTSGVSVLGTVTVSNSALAGSHSSWPDAIANGYLSNVIFDN
ncbi:hypothetical protein CN311_16080 [Mesorhizobium sanjuanii]|uniref:Right handed beta helix domain-containing protein n=1 Tax=Mesorhizobium sanjuanii TaxID=2037900 RepID=A0A2A6FED1_9HYPH|nr:hypothetical protein [Mesorhizobium sanjuanii]PDQ20083.1 hypothetical protein CN311_16080 [Mesorhizobium sanjuanii]